MLSVEQISELQPDSDSERELHLFHSSDGLLLFVELLTDERQPISLDTASQFIPNFEERLIQEISPGKWTLVLDIPNANDGDDIEQIELETCTESMSRSLQTERGVHRFVKICLVDLDEKQGGWKGMWRFLTSIPAVEKMLGYLPLNDWIQLRKVSRDWKSAVDLALSHSESVDLRQLDCRSRPFSITEILEAIDWIVEKAPNIERFFGLEIGHELKKKSQVVQLLLALEKLPRLKSLNLDWVLPRFLKHCCCPESERLSVKLSYHLLNALGPTLQDLTLTSLEKRLLTGEAPPSPFLKMMHFVWPQMKNLKSLVVSDCPAAVIQEAISRIPCPEKLTRMSLSKRYASDVTVTLQNATFPSLTYLDVVHLWDHWSNYFDMPVNLFSEMGHMSTLKTLKVAAESSAHLEQLSCFVMLTALELHLNDLTGSIADLANLTNLKALTLYAVPTGLNLQVLESLPNLTSLSLFQSTEYSSMSFKYSSPLTDLLLSAGPIPSCFELSLPAEVHSLETLTLEGKDCQFRNLVDGLFKMIPDLKRLILKRNVRLSSVKVEDFMKCCPKLAMLRIEEADFSADWLSAFLKSKTNLMRLELYPDVIARTGIASLVPSNVRLVEIEKPQSWLFRAKKSGNSKATDAELRPAENIEGQVKILSSSEGVHFVKFLDSDHQPISSETVTELDPKIEREIGELIPGHWTVILQKSARELKQFEEKKLSNEGTNTLHK